VWWLLYVPPYECVVFTIFIALLEGGRYYMYRLMNVLLEDITTRKKSLFQAAKMTKRCSTKALYSPTKIFMNLEESHFQVTKRPNRGFVNTYRSRCHAAWVIAFSGRQNARIVFTRNQVPMCSGSHNSTEWHFQGIKMSNMAQRYSNNLEPRVTWDFRNRIFMP